MKFLRLLVLLLITIMIGIFAVNNSQLVDIDLQPLPFKFAASFFFVIFVILLCGVILGGTGTSFRALYWKRIAKSREKKIAKLETQLREAKRTKPSTELSIIEKKQ
ncbi:MAG: hypothetical protein COV36_03170 [Alphaproteobacteria bacterium CG11_big_fil_rev_8_21_14_0_20_44_7]|nr:MAG: hypothetical protein COV36_03170 [Alphaproteobacteria bacterium CG11_big_fil_rev_8_21_14_0_20_44_7]